LKECAGKFSVANEFRDDLYEIFKGRLNKKQNFLYGIKDETILLKNCIEFLNVK